MLSHITNNWRGRPLESRAVVVNWTGSTATHKGLRIQAQLAGNGYEARIKASDEDLAGLAIERDELQGEWHDRLRPRHTTDTT